MPFDTATLQSSLDEYLTAEIEAGSFPGAVYAVGNSEGIRLENALGHSVVKPARIRARIETIYDVASLTKPLVTSTLVLRAAAEGLIDLDEPVSKHLSELRGTDKGALSFTDLLTHRGGLEAWYPLYTEGEGSEAYLQALVHRPLSYQPGTQEIYSDLGFILLHLAMERIHGSSAEERARKEIFEPLGLVRAGFHPPPESKSEIAATEWGNGKEQTMVAELGLSFNGFRDYLLWGETNDGNAWHMGGMAGNAGLFATAREVFAIARSFLRGGEKVLPREMVERSLRNYTTGLEENRGLGWQLRATSGEGPTTMFSEKAFGHTGFTGTSVWTDPERDLIVVLLTNRLHPVFQPLNMQAIRRQVHLRVVEAWPSASS